MQANMPLPLSLSPFCLGRSKALSSRKATRRKKSVTRARPPPEACQGEHFVCFVWLAHAHTLGRGRTRARTGRVLRLLFSTLAIGNEGEGDGEEGVGSLSLALKAGHLRHKNRTTVLGDHVCFILHTYEVWPILRLFPLARAGNELTVHVQLGAFFLYHKKGSREHA